MSEATDIVDRQVDAYLARDLEGFLSCYSPDVTISDFEGNLVADFSGMREQYGCLFRESPDLTGRIVNRMVVGDTVVDEEELHGFKHPVYPSDVHAAVAYHVRNGKIDRVVFLKVE